MIYGENYLSKLGLGRSIYRSDMALYKILIKENITEFSMLMNWTKPSKKNEEFKLMDCLTTWVFTQNVLAKYHRNNESIITEIGVDENDYYFVLNRNHILFQNLSFSRGICSMPYYITVIEMLETYFKKPSHYNSTDLHTIINSFGLYFAKRFYKNHFNWFFERLPNKSYRINYKNSYCRDFIKQYKVDIQTFNELSSYEISRNKSIVEKEYRTQRLYHNRYQIGNVNELIELSQEKYFADSKQFESELDAFHNSIV